MNYRTSDGDRVGVVRDEKVVDVQRALAARGVEVGPGIRELISREDWHELLAPIDGSPKAEAESLALDELDIGPIIPDPKKIIFVGGNTYSHLEEAAPYTEAKAPQRPMVTAKTSNAINGPYDPIVAPEGTHSMDYEAELCVVIGTRTSRVSADEAGAAIAGYSVVNDVSDREYQLSTWEDNSFYRTHFLGKSFDGFCPCGPFLTTPDEIENRDELRVRCIVNGEVKQDGDLAELYFSPEQVISHLSVGITLEPGDLILMGSPSGVAHFLNPPPYLKPGDVVRCEVDSLGHIENEVVAATDRRP